MKLNNRVVVITGAGSGIGRASALEFAKNGAAVAIVDIDLDRARETVRLVENDGGIARALSCDVAQADSVQRLVSDTLETFSRVDVLLNNAAIQVNKTIEDTSVEEWNRQIAVHLGGVFLCSKFFLPQLRTTRGCIINV